MICRHCQRNKAIRPRGLCWKCYYAPGVRDQYAPLTPAGSYALRREPTEAELDALIAQQSAALPEWWNESADAMAKRPVPKISVALTPKRKKA